MKIVQDIIEELIDSDKTLTNPILKTKVLATKLKNHKLLYWVNKELNGYESNEDVPNYRTTSANIIGCYVNGNAHYTDQPLATSGLPAGLAKIFNQVQLKNSVQTLESFTTNKKQGMLSQPLSAEMCGMITDQYQEQGNIFFNVLNARKHFGLNTVIQALSEIRSKLLDLMLALDEESNSIDLNNLKPLDKQKLNKLIVENMSYQINTGDGIIATQGNKNDVKAQITITERNIDDLRRVLNENGVEKNDITELIEIIDSEKPRISENKPGEKVAKWMKKMVGKSIDGSWQIGIGAAGELLAQIISKYYGMQ